METETIDAKTETASSTDSQVTETDAQTSSVESSTTQDVTKGGEEPTLADVVKQAAEDSAKSSTEEAEKTETPETESEVKEEPTEETKAEGKKEEDSDASKDVPFHKHPRWVEVQKEKETLRGEVQQLKPLADRAKALDDFCRSNGVTDEDLREALTVAALLRTDPKQARDRMRSYLEQVETALGDRMPADIQKRLDEGLIDAATAKELTELRLKTQVSVETQKRQQMDAAQRATLDMSNAVSQWETAKKTSDPEWDKKYPLLDAVFTKLVSTKAPKTAADVIAIAEEAYKTVNEQLAGFTPKPAPKKVLTTNGSSTKAKPELALDSLDDLGKLVRQVASARR